MNKLLTPISTNTNSSSLIVDKEKRVIATFYGGKEISNEVVRRVNIYDKIKLKLNKLQEMIDEPNAVGTDCAVKMKDVSTMLDKIRKEI